MKTHATTPDKGYVITVTSVPCNVSAIMEGNSTILLLTAQKAGQYGFIATSSQITVDDDNAVISETDYSLALVGTKTAGSYILPPATTDTLGGIKIGSGLSVTEDGTTTVNWTGLPANIFQTDQATIVTGKTSFTESVPVGDAINQNDAVNLEQLESGKGIKSPSQVDFRILAPFKGLADPVSYMDRVYNMSTDKVVAFGQTNFMNGGDGNNYHGRVTTTVLDLPDLTETLRQDSARPASSSIGQAAYFGLTAQMPAFGEHTATSFYMLKDSSSKVVPRYDIPSHFLSYYNAGNVFRSIPAVFSTDYHTDRKLRAGFVPSSRGSNYQQAIAKLDDELIYQYGLLACLPTDAIRLIQVWGGGGGLTSLLPANYHGMWIEKKKGERIFLGMVLSNYSFCHFGLILAPFGNFGVGSCRMYEGDIFGLATGDRLPTSCYPLDRSMSVVEAAGGTRVSNILLPDKTYTFVKADDFLTLTDNGAGELTVTVAANATGAERRGLIDITLSNGLTYSIHITQKG